MTPRPNEQNGRRAGTELALEVWKRRKWLALVVFAASLGAAISLTMSLPDLHRATATVLVERQQVSEAFVRPTVTAELETRIQTVHTQVMSRTRLADVIHRFDLYPELQGRATVDAIVGRMRHDLDFALSGVEQTTGRAATIAFTLSYSGRNPVTVAEVANALAGYYIEENSRSREQQAVKTAEFLRVQLDAAKRELDEQQRRAGDFKQRHSGELPQQVEVNLAALDRLNTQLRLNGEYQIRAMERREHLEQRQASPPAAGGIPSDAPDEQLAKLRQQLADLRRSFSDQYPDVIRVKKQIAALEGDRSDESAGQPPAPAPERPGRASAQSLAAVDADLARLKAEEGLLRKVIAGYEARVEIAPKRQEELTELSRDYDADKERYGTLLKRFEEAQLAEHLEHGQNVERFRVLDQAMPSSRPVAPNRPWLLMMGLAASAALAIGSVVAAEKLDTTFHSADDVRAFAPVPMLAVIRRIPTRHGMPGHRVRLAVVTVSIIVALVLIVGAAYYVGSDNEQLVRMTTRGRG